MRGDAERQANIMLAVTPGSFVPTDHPIRRIKPIVDSALRRSSTRCTQRAGGPRSRPNTCSVGCLLRMAKMGAESIRVEADEDLEIYWPDGVL